MLVKCKLRRDDILEEVCSDCPYYHVSKGSYFDPDEFWCDHCDFGNDFICENITEKLAELIDGDGLETGKGCIANASVCSSLEPALNTSWEDHAYWYIPHDGSAPIPYSSLDEIWEELFV